MKSRSYYLCFTLLLLLQSCIREDCTYLTQGFCNQEKILTRNLQLSSSNNGWLSTYTSGKIYDLSNKKGYDNTYTVAYKYFDFSKVEVNKQPFENSCCKGKGVTTTKLPIQHELVHMTSEGTFGSILMMRDKNVQNIQNLKDSFSADNIPEYLTIKVKNSLALFIPDENVVDSLVTYKEHLSLSGDNYSKVFVVKPRTSSGEIVVKEYYYSEADGLIGFLLTNNELWFLKAQE